MLALKTFRTAAVTLAGVELAHRIRKRQFSLLVEDPSIGGPGRVDREMRREKKTFRPEEFEYEGYRVPTG
jgi:hypothetical protein